MSIADGDHGGQNVVPGLLFHHHLIGEHAAVPAKVSKGLGQPAILAVQPVSRVVRDAQLAVGVIGQTVVAGLVVRAGTFHRAIVLRHVEINGPGTKRRRKRFHGRIQPLGIGPVPIRRQDGVFGGVVAESVEECVGHVRLETDSLRAVRQFQQLDHLAPTVHAAPADFALGSKPLAVTLSDIRRLAKRFRDQPGAAFGVREPVSGAARGINAHHAVAPNAELSQLRGDATAFADLFHELFSLLFAAHGRTASGGRPDRRDHRTDHEPSGGHPGGQFFQIVIARINVDMRIEKKNVHAVKFDAVHFGSGSQIEHRVEVDERFGPGAAFANQPRPHGVVKPGIIVVAVNAHGLSFSLNVLPG